MNSSARCDEIVRLIDEALAANEASGVARLAAADEGGPRRRRPETRRRVAGPAR